MKTQAYPGQCPAALLSIRSRDECVQIRVRLLIRNWSFIFLLFPPPSSAHSTMESHLWLAPFSFHCTFTQSMPRFDCVNTAASTALSIEPTTSHSRELSQLCSPFIVSSSLSLRRTNSTIEPSPSSLPELPSPTHTLSCELHIAATDRMPFCIAA